MSDRPDFTLPVSIEAYTIETLPIDIAAQTVGNIDINIAGQAANVDVNLAASAVTLNVDITAQSVGSIDVNIAASAVTIYVQTAPGEHVGVEIRAGVEITNRGQLVNADFEQTYTTTRVLCVGWFDGLGAHKSSGAQFWSGYKAITLKDAGTPAAANGIQQPLSPSIPTDNIAGFTIMHRNVDWTDDGTFKIELKYDDGTSSTQTITASALESWTQEDVTYTSGKRIIGIRIYTDHATFAEWDVLYLDALSLRYREELQGIIDTVDIDVVAQTVGNIDINIAAQADNVDVNIAASAVTINVKTGTGEHVDSDIVSSITLDVDITAQTVGNIAIDIAAQSVGNINVDIAAQTVDINIKTSGGANIVIDKLTQTAYTERRSTISNNGTRTGWTSPLTNDRRGKFFPRGCRGFITTIDLYCYDAGAAGGTITVYLTPHPSMGYLYSADVTVPAEGSADWRSATFNKMWNYDSLFIFIKSSSADMDVGTDAGTPYDWYASSDAGATWTTDNYRLHARVVMKGETIGDLPVSGTLNTVEIPGKTTTTQHVAVTVAASDENYATATVGAGKLLIAIFSAMDDTERDVLRPRLKVDGAQVLPIDCPFNYWHDYYMDESKEGIFIGVWDTTNGYYSLVVTLPIPFKQKIEVGYYNSAASQQQAEVAYTVELLT